MDSIARIHHPNSNPLNLSIHHHRPSFSKPISSSSLSFKTLSNSKTFVKFSSSSLPPPFLPTPLPKTLYPLTTFLKTTCITSVTTTLFLSRFTKPSIASPISQPTTESTTTTTDSDEEKEALKALMEIKIKTRKFQEAIGIIDRLIQIEPFEKEWPLLKAHVYSYSGDIESAKLGFEEILSKNPLVHVYNYSGGIEPVRFGFEEMLSKNPFMLEAYQGFIMEALQTESDEVEDVTKIFENAVEQCRKEKKKEALRDFQLLLAQFKVVEGKYTDALKVYQELVKEEPGDFRWYLCQGIIYTLLKKQDEAEKQFQKYRRLLPKGHPYARYFED